MSVLYKSIFDSLRTSILNSTLSSGQKLPSSRTLAVELGVSRNTVLAAFAHLETEGFIESRHGSGMYVRTIPHYKSTPVPSRHKPAAGTIDIQPAVTFIAATDEKSFPFHEFARITSRIYREGKILNDNSLEKQLSAWLHIKRGVRCRPEQIILTNGSQEALWLTAMYLRHSGYRNVILENPCYNGARNIFRKTASSLHYVPVDHNGMQVQKIQSQKNSMVYVTPSRQFPLGHTLGIDRRLALLHKAEKQNLMIIEDDFDSDFRYSGEPVASLQSYDQSGRVIYIGTFSKVLFNSIRLGYCIIPEAHLEKFRQLRNTFNQPPSPVTRRVVAEFMKSGRFHKHLKKMHTLYEERKDFMARTIEKELGDFLEIVPCDSGLHMTAFFKKSVPAGKLKTSLHQQGIEIFLLSDNWHGKPERDGFVLGFAALHHNECIRAVKLLKKAIASAA